MTLYEVIEGLIVEFHDIDKVFYVYFYILLFATYVGIQISKTIHLKRSCCAARPHFASLVRFCISLHVIVLGYNSAIVFGNREVVEVSRGKLRFFSYVHIGTWFLHHFG